MATSSILTGKQTIFKSTSKHGYLESTSAIVFEVVRKLGVLSEAWTEQCEEHILNIYLKNKCIGCFSMGGHRMVPSADEHFYCATKHAVTALTEGIRQELREANTHIRATVGHYQHKLCL